MNHHNEDLIKLRLPSENALRHSKRRTRVQSVVRLIGTLTLLGLFGSLFFMTSF